MKTFPDTLYLRWEDSGDGELFLVAETEPKAHAMVGEEVPVGVYEFQRRGKVRARVEVE